MSISGIFGKSNLSKLELVIEFPQEIYAGNQFPAKITMQNRRRFMPAFLVGFSAERISALLPFTPNKGESSLYISVTFHKRGLYTIDKPYIYSVFPFNFFTRYKKLDRTYTVTVFPSLKACDLATLYRMEKKTRGERASDKIGYDTDIISIREYVRGDPLKYIHWKATAKTGRLKTKEHSSLSYQPVTIDFDRVLVNDLEERISCVAYTIVQLIKTSVPVGLRINGRFFPPDVTAVHKLNMLRELALYKTGDGS